MNNPSTDHLYRQITKWFHESGAIDSVYHLYSKFLRYIQVKKLKLDGFEKSLWFSLCRATCTLRKAYLLQFKKGITRNYSSSRPQGWKEEYEEYWNLILEDLFSESILQSFFEPEEEEWEHDVRNWREVISCFLPDYICPTFELLEQFGYIVHENDEWIPYEEKTDDWYDI